MEYTTKFEGECNKGGGGIKYMWFVWHQCFVAAILFGFSIIMSRSLIIFIKRKNVTVFLYIIIGVLRPGLLNRRLLLLSDSVRMNSLVFCGKLNEYRQNFPEHRLE